MDAFIILILRDSYICISLFSTVYTESYEIAVEFVIHMFWWTYDSRQGSDQHIWELVLTYSITKEAWFCEIKNVSTYPKRKGICIG